MHCMIGKNLINCLEIKHSTGWYLFTNTHIHTSIIWDQDLTDVKVDNFNATPNPHPLLYGKIWPSGRSDDKKCWPPSLVFMFENITPCYLHSTINMNLKPMHYAILIGKILTKNLKRIRIRRNNLRFGIKKLRTRYYRSALSELCVPEYSSLSTRMIGD